jgi:porin
MKSDRYTFVKDKLIKMRKYLPTIILLAFFSYTKGQTHESPVHINTLYIGEYFSNFSGGIKTGRTYQGLLDFGITFNSSGIGLWQNGEFSIQLENTHGGRPTQEYIGDLQVASNIENGDFTYLYELWYKHQLNRLGIKFGLMDLNADCYVSELGGHFLNSSFGVMPTASLNMPAPIFPLTALGLLANYNFNGKLKVKAGIWDGNPGDFENNRYNIEWTINNREGYLYLLEGHYNFGTLNNKLASIKLGVLYHSGSFQELLDSTKNKKGNLEFHLIAEHALNNKYVGEKGKLDGFLQVGYAPDEKISNISLYVGAGVNIIGLFLPSSEDILGLGIAYASLSKELSKNTETDPYEMSVELSYSIPILNNITLQPDFQYIINPGADAELKNAVTAFVRIIIKN